MRNSLNLYRFHKLARDFVCALVVFSAMFVVMSPSSHEAAPIPILSLLSGSVATAAVHGAVPHFAQVPPGVRAVQSPRFTHLAGTYAASYTGRETQKLTVQPLSPSNMPLISTMLALMFSALVAFNLALLRHLRRVNASSRRGAWRGG